MADQQDNQVAITAGTAEQQLAVIPAPQAPDATTTTSPSPGSASIPGETLSKSEQTNLNNPTADSNQNPTDTPTGPATSESAFGPNAKYYDFSKMSASQIAATGTIGGSPYAANTTSSSPDAITSAGTAPITNRLHNYPSYTYGLSWHGLTDTQYNNVVQNQTYTPANVLVASAGRYGSDFPRNEFFTDDFYFDNLDMTTIIGPNDNSRNTNAIELSFTLIEPYGFTLVERMLQYADAIKSGNYLDMPYLLQIDFFAIDNAGNIVGSIESLRKRIPIKLIKMDIKVSNRGAEYSIQAVPFNHSAYDSSSISTPANFEVVGSTVGDFFTSTEDAQTTEQANSAVQRETPQSQTTPTNSANTSAGATNPTNTTPPPPTFTQVKSYGSAINAWNSALKNAGKQDTADVYKFDIDPIIAGSGFTKPKSVDPKAVPMKDTNNTDDQIQMRRAVVPGSNQGVYDNSKVIFQVQSGTTIEKLLEHIIRSSDYVQKQLIVPEDPDYASQKEQYKDQPLNWFKIVPSVILTGFDNVKKVWAREITYSIKPYKIYNIRSDVGPQGVQIYPVKAYNYIYTGQNDDVLDFDIIFNALYYTQVTAYRDSLSSLTNTGDSSIVQDQTDNSPSYSGSDNTIVQQANAVTPTVKKNIVQNSQATATGGATTAKEVASLDLVDSLMTNSQADMLNLKLKIIGDPDYIKQDDVFYRTTNNTNAAPTKPTGDTRLINNGSLVMDDGCLYVQVLFRTPTDIDESTGLMKFDSKYTHSIFSGLYQVLTVKSSFAQGKFEQELELIRCPRQQAFDYVNGQQNTNSDNRKPLTVQTNPGISPPAPIPTILVSGGNASTDTANATDTGDTTTGQDQPIAQAQAVEPPAQTDPNAADLAEVNATAPTADITAQNQPQE